MADNKYMTPEDMWKNLRASKTPKGPSKWLPPRGNCEFGNVAKQLKFDDESIQIEVPEPSAPVLLKAQTFRMADMGGYVMYLHRLDGQVVYIDSETFIVLLEKLYMFMNGKHDLQRAVIYNDKHKVVCKYDFCV